MLTPPFIITAVVVQKKNPSRCSVFINGEFAFGCVMDVVVQHRLVNGRELTAQELKRLEEQEEIIQLKQTALRYATYKSRTAHEVRKKMLEKEYSPDEAEYAVQFLEAFGYVNDAAYARNFIQEIMRLKPSGEARIKQELRKRGISANDAEDALTLAFPKETSRDTIRELALAAAEKKNRSLGRKDNVKRKQLLIGYLQRQGFSWEVIKGVVEDVLGTDGQMDDIVDDDA
jgi:regulatory protein